MSTHRTTRVTTIPLTSPRPCDGGLLPVPAGHYDWIRLLVGLDGPQDHPGAAELDEEVWLHYREGVDPEWMRTTGTAEDGRRTARIPVPRRDELLAVRLPDRPGVTVHAADCVGRLPAADTMSGA
ncbi:hypothetical protein [Streptomyces sp. NPDC050546]|uniref:hypothetical protein n=1 Tax=Streptomyces sp. NPDC050546 TaxID=3365628 RepID=UPI0037A8DCEA